MKKYSEISLVKLNLKKFSEIFLKWKSALKSGFRIEK